MTAQRTNPATRAGHSVIRLPRSIAGMRGITDDDRQLRDPDLAVYVAMVDLADNASHLLRMETARIAARAGVHVATVRRTLKSRLLQDLGLIRDTVEPSQTEVVAPSISHEGGFLSVPRSALWLSPEASLGMPAYALQSLLVLIATSDWGGESSTSLRSSRFRQTMAGDLIDMRRFERGLHYLDALPWVRVEAQPYSAAMAQWGMARRMPTVRILDWAALPAYESRAVETLGEPLDAPLRRAETPQTATVAPATAVPAQRRTAAVVAPVYDGTAERLADTLMADAGSLSNVDLAAGFAAEASTDPRPRVVAALRVLLDAGWRQDAILEHVRVQGVRKGAGATNAVGWLFRIALPQATAPVDVVPTLSWKDLHPTAKTLTDALTREGQQTIGRWGDEEPPF